MYLWLLLCIISYLIVILILQVRVFNLLTGKLSRVYDESLARFSELQQKKQQIPNIEFIRR